MLSYLYSFLSISIPFSRCDIPSNWVVRPNHYGPRPTNSFCPSSFVSRFERQLQQAQPRQLLHQPWAICIPLAARHPWAGQGRAGKSSPGGWGSAMHSSLALSLKASIKAVICSDTTFQRHTTRSGQQETDSCTSSSSSSSPSVSSYLLQLCIFSCHFFLFPLLSLDSLERVARALNASIMQMKLTFVLIFVVIVCGTHMLQQRQNDYQAHNT